MTFKSIHELYNVPWPECSYVCAVYNSLDNIDCCENGVCICKIIENGLKNLEAFGEEIEVLKQIISKKGILS